MEFMEPITLSMGFNVLLAIAAYFLKAEHATIKADLRSLKDSKVEKTDFSEFKQDVFKRLDRFEDNVKAELQELRK